MSFSNIQKKETSKAWRLREKITIDILGKRD